MNVDSTSGETLNSRVGDIPLEEQDEKKMTLGDALSMSRWKDASLTSVEELHNLAGGADIKVHFISKLQLHIWHCLFDAVCCYYHLSLSLSLILTGD